MPFEFHIDDETAKLMDENADLAKKREAKEKEPLSPESARLVRLRKEYFPEAKGKVPRLESVVGQQLLEMAEEYVKLVCHGGGSAESSQTARRKLHNFLSQKLTGHDRDDRDAEQVADFAFRLVTGQSKENYLRDYLKNKEEYLPREGSLHSGD
jgi:hypothetical protein